MNKKGYISIFVVIVALLSFLSGFCVAPISAKNAMSAMTNDIMATKMAHTSDDGKTMMPCCEDDGGVGKDGIFIEKTDEKIVFDVLETDGFYNLYSKNILQPIDSSSLTAPPVSRLVSTTIKKE